MHGTVFTGPRAVHRGQTPPVESGGLRDAALASSAPACLATAAPLHLRPIVLGALLALVTAVLTPTPVWANTKAWSGFGGDANWTNPGNWQGTAPLAGDDLVFPLGGGQVTNNDFPAGTSFNSINISAAGYTLNGNAVTIAAGQSITANYRNGGRSTINLPISANGMLVHVVQAGSTLVFGGGLIATGLDKDGSGTAVLQAPGGTQFGFNVSAGILNVQNGSALGINGVGVSDGGTLQVQDGITLTTLIDPVGIGATNAAGAVESVSGNNTLTGGIQLSTGDAALTIDSGSTLTVSTNPIFLSTHILTANVVGAATIASPIQDTGGLTKTGTGALTLSGSSTYAGPTTVNAGTLLVNGSQSSSSVTVASGATLGGTGTTGPLSINGIVNPGVGGPGILHSGKTVFNAGSTFAVDLNGTSVGSGYDLLSAAGTLALAGPTLSVSVGFPSTTGNTYTILQSTGGLSGTFAGLPEGATFTSGGRTFRLNYTVLAVTLTDVTPAPTFTPTPTITPLATPTACILGDINCDGIVDIRDYGLWRQHFGQANCGNAADLNGDCLVDVRDYGIWRANFGHTAGASISKGMLLAGGALAPRGTSGPAAPVGHDRVAESEGAMPVIPVAGGLLGLGGLAGWRTRRRPPAE